MSKKIKGERVVKIVHGKNWIELDQEKDNAVGKGKDGHENHQKRVRSNLRGNETDDWCTGSDFKRLAILYMDENDKLYYSDGSPVDQSENKPKFEILIPENDEVCIETTGNSPGCTWYFFNGVWYRVCG